MKKSLKIYILLIFSFCGCKETILEIDPAANGSSYYPLAVGDFRQYSVTDIRFRDNIGDTSRYELREVVDTSFTDQTNTLSYKIIRSVRPNQHSAWREDSVFVVTKSLSNVTETKDNTRRVKLVFPIKNGKTWTADAFNANQVNNEEDGKERYSFSEVGTPFTIGGNTYGETVTVIQGRPTKNLINLDNRKEVYALGIGMVYRLFNKAIYCNQMTSGDCPYGEDFIIFGHERHEVLTAHGKR